MHLNCGAGKWQKIEKIRRENKEAVERMTEGLADVMSKVSKKATGW
jgi:hypothetical protein